MLILFKYLIPLTCLKTKIGYFRHTKILLRFGSESDVDKTSGRWSVFFPKNIPDIYKRQFSLIEFSHLDKHNSSIEFTLVYPGIYTINYDNGKESDSMILKGKTWNLNESIFYMFLAWIPVKRTMLYCPPYSQVNHKNEFIVRVSSIDDEWLRPDWEKYNFYGDMSHHWYGDLPDSATYSNGAAHNSKCTQYHLNHIFICERKI